MQDKNSPSIRRDIPLPIKNREELWGSDAIAQMLRELEIPYVVLNPGASFRGLHDSLVNYLGNEKPQMLVVLHEEHAIAIAHGYAKVTGKMLAAIVHSNVGLMHATMGIFNAWADRVPVLVLGATGPVDAAKRRPWIDWLHTAQDQGALIRNYSKWDAQPASVPAAMEAMLRARQIADTAPRGPTYVCFDVSLQESKLPENPTLPDPSRFLPGLPPQPSDAAIRQAADLLSAAKKPVILMGRVSRSVEAWQQRVALAEALDADVLTDLKIGAAFPTDHPLHATPPSFFLSPDAVAILKAADVVLSLDWLDLAGALKQTWGDAGPPCQVIQVSVDQYSHNGWSMDHQGLPAVDINLLSEPDIAVPLLLKAVTKRTSRAPSQPQLQSQNQHQPQLGHKDADGSISVATLAHALRRSTAGRDVCLMRLPLGWSGELWNFRHPLDYLGFDGGGGIGSGPGMAVGSALALKSGNRLPVAVIGDGDFMMGVSAFWTAANAQIPLFTVVCNNRSYFNDELHQERVAKDRDRPVENRWIGQRIGNPDIDLAMIARGQGLVGIGPVTDPAALEAAFAEGIEAVMQGKAVVIDVRVTPGYSPSMASGMTRSHDDIDKK